jgi:hypothetical protein
MSADSRISAMLETHRRARERAEQLLADRGHRPIFPDVMTPDHPLAIFLGFDRASALIDNPGRRRDERADARRDGVRRLTLEGKRIKDIAEELGISYSWVTKLRKEMGLTRL